MAIRLLALGILIGAGFGTAQDAKPPSTPVRNVVDEYFGVKVDDPYRYLEKLDDPEVAAWFKAQAAYTSTTLAAIPGRDAVLARLQELDRSTPASIRNVRRLSENRVYYEKQPAGENVFRLYVRDGFRGAERLLVSPETFVTKTSEHMTVDWWEPSRDGRYVAFGISPSGSERPVLHIIDTASGKLLPDTIDRCRMGEVSWAEDNRSFLYNRLPKVAANAPPAAQYQNSHVYRHVLGRDPEQDPAVLGPGAPGVTPEPNWRPFTVFTPGSHYVLGVFVPGAEKRRIIYKQPIAAWGTQNDWTKLVDLSDEVVSFAVHGDDLYLVSQRHASNRQLLVAKLSGSDLRDARMLIPRGASVTEDVIEDVHAASDALYVRLAEAGSGKVMRLEYSSDAPKAVPRPGSTSACYTNPQVAGAVIGIESWVQRDATYTYDPSTGAIEKTNLEPESPTDIRGLEVTDVRVKKLRWNARSADDRRKGGIASGRQKSRASVWVWSIRGQPRSLH